MDQPIKQITSVSMLQEYARGTVVELPEFSEDMPFIARVRRPSLLAMVKNKKIPNALLTTANRLFASGDTDFSNEAAMDEMYQLFDIICEATFVEPSWAEIKEAGVELTDQQYVAVFNYTQQGIKALEPFRTNREGTGHNLAGEDVQQDPK
jgi:hypothetical protein